MAAAKVYAGRGTRKPAQCPHEGQKSLGKKTITLRRPQRPTHQNFQFCFFYHHSQIEGRGFPDKRNCLCQHVITNSGAEREGKRDSGALGRMRISGHLRRTVLTVSRTSHYLFFCMMVPPAGSIPFLLGDGAPCGKQLAMPTTRSIGSCTREGQPFKQDNTGEHGLFILAKRAGLHFSPSLLPLPTSAGSGH